MLFLHMRLLCVYEQYRQTVELHASMASLAFVVVDFVTVVVCDKSSHDDRPTSCRTARWTWLRGTWEIEFKSCTTLFFLLKCCLKWILTCIRYMVPVTTPASFRLILLCFRLPFHSRRLPCSVAFARHAHRNVGRPSSFIDWAEKRESRKCKV